MKRFLMASVVMFLCIAAHAQKQKYISVAAFNTETDLPFGKFAGLFTGPVHPGIEIGYGKNFSAKQKHEWFVESKLAYFYHRFVQHGFPLYLNLGYRHKFGKRFSAETSVGAGYLHSIPATAKLKLNGNGEYVNNKGAGRMQAMATYGLGFGYTFHFSAANPITIFTMHQLRIQLPFVKSYVTLLPYNSFMIGIRKPIK